MVFVIGAAVIAVAASTAAWIYDAKTEEEKRKHSELRKKREEYHKRFDHLPNDHNLKTETLRIEAFKNLKQDYLNQINFFKNEKKNIKLDLRAIDKAIREELSNDSTSPYVKKSLLFEKNRVKDALKRLEAYWLYLDWFEKKLDEIETYKKYEDISEIQPSGLLPKDFLYIGKLATIKQHELDCWNLYGQNLELSSQKITEDKYSKEQELNNLQFYINNKIEDIPVFIDYTNKSNTFYKASIAKAELWQSIMTGGLLEVKPLEDERKNSKSLKIDYKGVKCFLDRENKKYPLKNYRKSFNIEVKVIENDYLMNQVSLTEKEEIIDEEINNEITILFEPKNFKASILSKLEYYLENFALSVSSIDIENNSVTFNISNFSLNCSIKTNKGVLELVKIQDIAISSIESFEPPFYFTFTPAQIYSKELQDSKKPLLNFIEFANNQTQYIKYSKENNGSDYDFFRKWNKALDFQISSNSFEETVYKFDSVSTDSSGLIFYINNEDVLTKISNLSDDNKIEVSIECKQTDNHPYKFLNLGRIDDILDNKIIIRLSHPSFADYIFNLRNEFIIRKPIYPSALIRQRNALKDFGIGKIVNSELKTQLISPNIIKAKIDSSWEDAIKKGIEWQNSKLTSNQKDTIKKVLLEKNISLIQGPPGTGKTTIIKEIAYQQLKHKPSEKILIVSQQNVAVDNALSRIYVENKTWFDEGKFSFVRIAPNEDKVSAELRKFTIENWFAEYKAQTQEKYSKLLYENPNFKEYCDDWWNLIDKENIRDVDNEIIEVLINSHNIIGATCVGMANRNIGLDLVEFDIAIVDEAGRATPPELLIPILRAKKVILIGDHYQLPPTYDRKLIEAINNDNEESLKSFDKDFLAKSFFENLFEQLPSSNKSMLTEQFRMPNDIGTLISELFYEKKLKNGLNMSSIDSFNEVTPIEWIDIKGKQEKKKGGTSSYNLKEVDKIYLLIKDIDNKLQKIKRIKNIAVITPYSEQKKKIRNKLNKLQLTNISTLKIDTIDAFQGEEAQIVIYSTVRTYGNLSFLIDRKRLNVAISRTQENLIFVGDKRFLKNAKIKRRRNLFSEIISIIANKNIIY
jgi:hypothetical protein